MLYTWCEGFMTVAHSPVCVKPLFNLFVDVPFVCGVSLYEVSIVLLCPTLSLSSSPTDPDPRLADSLLPSSTSTSLPGSWFLPFLVMSVAVPQSPGSA